MSNNPFFNTEAEKAIIAAMTENGVAGKHIFRLTPADFATEKHRKIYAAMQSLVTENKPIDYVFLAETMTRMYGNDDLMPVFFEAIKYRFGAKFLINDYIEIVQKASKRRKLSALLERLQKQLDDPNVEPDSLIEDAQTRLRSFYDGKNAECSKLHTVLQDAFAELEDRAKGKCKGMMSGLEILDSKTAGFHRGEMTIVGARPAVGKSAFAGQIALTAAKDGAKVCVCSREMTGVQYGIRVLAGGTNVSNIKIRTGNLSDEDWVQLTESMLLHGNDDVRFLFNTKYIEDLKAAAQAMKDGDGLDMLIVDYIQLMQSKQRFEKDYQRIGYISKMLKDMSIDLNIAVIALAQVGRSTEGSMPTLSELRGSGDLEQDADNVIFLHRPEDADDKWVKPSEKGVFGAIRSMKCQYIVMSIAKQRQGETGIISCVFNPAAMSFDNIGSKREE